MHAATNNEDDFKDSDIWYCRLWVTNHGWGDFEQILLVLCIIRILMFPSPQPPIKLGKESIKWSM